MPKYEVLPTPKSKKVKDIEPGSAIWVNYKNGEYCIYHKNFDDAEDLSEFYLKTKILEENDTDENVDKNITVNV